MSDIDNSYQHNKDPEDPVEEIMETLNLHFEQLQWIRSATNSLKTNINKLRI